MKLNILCCNPDGGAFLYITKGWEDAFKALGHNFKRWNGSDAQLKSYKPHNYLGCSGWQQNFPKWAKSEFGTKIAIHVNPWGNTILKPQKHEPNVNEPNNTIKWVEKQKPNFLYCYGIGEDIKHMWNHWNNKVAPVIPMPNAGNAVTHYPVAPAPKFRCDIGFIGGYWPYKAININKYFMPVLNKTNAKVFGWGGWRHSKYKGTIDDNDVNKLFSSSKICPAVVEPHTSRYGIDIPERMFKIPLGGGFVICDPCKGLERYISKNIFPTASNPKHYAELIHYYLKNDKERIRLKKEQRKAILKDHTYFARIQGFLKSSGYKDEAEKAKNKIAELLAGVA